jgi:hypothetical protein
MPDRHKRWENTIHYLWQCEHSFSDFPGYARHRKHTAHLSDHSVALLTPTSCLHPPLSKNTWEYTLTGQSMCRGERGHFYPYSSPHTKPVSKLFLLSHIVCWVLSRNTNRQQSPAPAMSLNLRIAHIHRSPRLEIPPLIPTPALGRPPGHTHKSTPQASPNTANTLISV